MNKNDLGKSPAFPTDEVVFDQMLGKNVKEHKDSAGMDLRTYIATKCLAGLLSDNRNHAAITQIIHEKGKNADEHGVLMAKSAIILADTLIAELSKNT